MDLLSLLIDSVPSLWDHKENATVARYTTKTTQNEVLDLIQDIFLENLIKRFKQSNYVSVESDH